VLAATTLLGAAIIAAAVATHGWPAAFSLAVLGLIPIALPLRGLLAGRRRTHTWATLCVLPYLVFGVMESVANPAARAAAACVAAASLLWFATLVGYLRVTRPAERPPVPPAPA
jgi:uncharacterized membrane protein